MDYVQILINQNVRDLTEDCDLVSGVVASTGHLYTTSKALGFSHCFQISTPADFLLTIYLRILCHYTFSACSLSSTVQGGEAGKRVIC